MSKIKLNPLVDLGLSTDPNYTPTSADAQEKVIEVDSDGLPEAKHISFDQPIETPMPEPAQPVVKMEETPVIAQTPAQTNSFAGIQDISSFATTHTMPVNANTQTNTPQVEPVTTVSSQGDDQSKMVSNVLLIIAVVLFLVSLGALIFFLLRYFRIV